jgi:hypothetical protein
MIAIGKSGFLEERRTAILNGQALSYVGFPLTSALSLRERTPRLFYAHCALEPQGWGNEFQSLREEATLALIPAFSPRRRRIIRRPIRSRRYQWPYIPRFMAREQPLSSDWRPNNHPASSNARHSKPPALPFPLSLRERAGVRGNPRNLCHMAVQNWGPQGGTGFQPVTGERPSRAQERQNRDGFPYFQHLRHHYAPPPLENNFA